MKNKFLKVFKYIVVFIIAFIAGYCTTSFKYNSKMLYPDCFDNLIEEHKFQKYQNDLLFEILYNYDAAVYATDSIEKQYYLHKIDSIYESEQ